jgi:hypothetical protein
MIFSVFAARWRTAKFCALVLVSLSSAGCGVLQRGAADGAMAPAVVSDDLALQPFDLARDCIPGSRPSQGQCSLPPDAQGVSTYDRISTLPNPDDQATWRNRLQDYLLWRSDKMCSRYKSEIIADQFGVNFALNVITTATAGVAGIVTAPAANILGALAAISSGTRGHFNEDFYQRTLAPAIIKEIDRTREDQLKKTMEKRGADGRVAMQAYTLEAAVADVERYQRLCSAAAALGTLVGDKTTKFSDTAEGIKQRIAMLREQQTLNEKQYAATGDTTAKQRLAETNADISQQIKILQQQLLTAPLTGG